MLSYEQILELIDRFEASDLSALEVRDQEFRLRLEREQCHRDASATSGPTSTDRVGSPAPSPPEGEGRRTPASPSATPGIPITSPIVGTFYAAPSPEAAPFVEVGDRVEVGQVICIVEAMKMMNEIEADQPGVVAEVVARNGEPIGYGDPILLLRD